MFIQDNCLHFSFERGWEEPLLEPLAGKPKTGIIQVDPNLYLCFRLLINLFFLKVPSLKSYSPGCQIIGNYFCSFDFCISYPALISHLTDKSIFQVNSAVCWYYYLLGKPFVNQLEIHQLFVDKLCVKIFCKPTWNPFEIFSPFPKFFE